MTGETCAGCSAVHATAVLALVLTHDGEIVLCGVCRELRRAAALATWAPTVAQILDELRTHPTDRGPDFTRQKFAAAAKFCWRAADAFVKGQRP